MSDIPHYFLYGEEAPSESLSYLHIAELQQSLPRHNWEIHPHRHDNLHQLLIVRSGTVAVQIHEDYREERGPYIISVPAREVHGFVHQPDVQGFIITIASDFLLDLFRDREREVFTRLLREPLVVRAPVDSTVSGQLDSAMAQLWNEYQEPGAAPSSMLGAYLKILFILIHRSWEGNDKTLLPQDAKVALYERFGSLLEAHYKEHWSVEQYAGELGLSVSRLNRLCQRCSGQNALQIIHERLLTETKRQLIYTQLSAKEISYKLGFKDPGYFSRFFSRHVGMAPGRFKKQIREQRQI